MFSRIRRAWKIAGMSDVAVVDKSLLSEKESEALSEAPGVVETPIGDGNAEFFGDPTAKDELEHQREEDGTAPWYKRIKDL